MEKDQPQSTHNQFQTIIDAKSDRQDLGPNTKNNKNVEIAGDNAKQIQVFLHSFASAKQVQKHPESQAQFVKENVATLKHKNTDQFRKIIQNSLIQEYQDVIDDRNIEKITIESVRTFQELIRLFKDHSVNATIVNATFEVFRNLWMKHHGKHREIMNQLILPVWRSVPYQQLSTFLKDFGLRKSYQSIKPKEMFGIIASGLFENKIQQHCQYYRLFKPKNDLKQKDKELFQKFQDEQIIPRITKKDQLFSEYVLNLIKKDEDLAQKVFDCVDMKEYEKLLNLTKKDIKKHPRLLKYVMMKTYKDVLRYKEWYIIEDKISFCPKFIKWFVKDIEKTFKKHQKKQPPKEVESDCSNKSHKKHNFGIKNQGDAEKITQSLLFRAKYTEKRSENYLENPLYELDDYIPAQLILNSIQQLQDNSQYLTLEFFNSTPNNIFFIDSPNQLFHQACNALLKAQIVGFDSEFWATPSKYEEGGVSVIQLSVKQNCYIFDYRAFMQCKQFNDFLTQLFQSQKIVKVGHSVSNDFRQLFRTFHQKITIRSFLDLVTISNKLYPQLVQKSLAVFCQKFLGKKMCKYEQRSNWNRRPLKKTQLAYASIDALVCAKILDVMLSQKKIKLLDLLQTKPLEIVELGEDLIDKKQKKQSIKQKEEEIKQVQDFDFKRFQQYCKKPIFLVDNMLKKLCSTMRNCGIDAEFISIRDHDLAVSQCKKQKRIFVTRDTKTTNKKFMNIPVYLLKEKTDSDIMFKQLVQTFSIDLSQFQTLSRCVKCNNDELLVITRDEATKEIQFIYEDNEINEFWRCSQCKQIYWEGGQFKKAKNKYEQLRK